MVSGEFSFVFVFPKFSLLILHYIQLVTPSEVATAVKMLMAI